VTARLGSVLESQVMEAGQNGSLKIMYPEKGLVPQIGILWSRDNAHLLSMWAKPGAGSGSTSLIEQSASGTGEARELGQIPGGTILDDISPNGKFLLYL